MANVIETKVFTGVLDSNTAIEYMEPNDLLDGSNVRIHTSEDNRQGLVVTLEGTRELSRPLPTGTNTVIRAKYFESNNRAYIFTHNSNGRHQITEFDPVTETFSEIYEELTDSNGVAILNLQQTEKIKDVLLIDDEFIVFGIFPRDEVKMLNLRLAKSGAYSPFIAQDFDLGTHPPTTAPTASYRNSDANTGAPPYNNLRGKLFQFRYRFKYLDGRYSDYSPISNRPSPEAEVDSQGNIVDSDIIGVTIGPIGNRVQEVEISARDGNNDWYTTLTKSRSWFTNLPPFVAREIPQPPPNPPLFVFRYDIAQQYTPVGSGYYIPFFNDGLYLTDVQLEHDLIASAVPRKTRALEFVNGTNLLLGNNLNGYPRPELGSGQFSVSTVLGPSPIEAPANPGDMHIVASYRNVGEDWTRNEIVFDGLPEVGDEIIGTFMVWAGAPTYTTVSYTVTSGEAGNLVAALQAWIDELAAEFPGNVDNPQVIITSQEGLPAALFWTRNANLSLSGTMRVQLSGGFNDLNLSVGSIKKGSSFSLIPAYYDSLGRPLPLPITSEATVQTPTPATSVGSVPFIDWSLTGAAPDGAAWYTILSSTNRVFEDVWDVVAKVDAESTPDEYKLDITSMYMFNRDRDEGPPSYDYANGDRVQLISNVNVNTGEQTNWGGQMERIYDVKDLTEEVLEESDPLYNNYPNHVKYILTVQRPTTDHIDPDEPILIQIIRPRKSNEDTKVFYEIGLPMYPVIGGSHSTESGRIEFIDSYVKLRRVNLPWESLNPSVDVEVESFHFSDNYISNYYSLGRPRSFYDTPEGLWNHAEIRWSDVYIRDTQIKNMSRFYPESIFQADHSYGAIHYLFNRENRVMCIQEDKVGYIPVYRSIIVDNAEQEQIATSNKLLNPISYYAGRNMGIGKESVVLACEFANGVAYFLDGNKMLPARAAISGTDYIGGKYSGALKARIKQVIDNNEFVRIIHDNRMEELLLVFNDSTWVFSERFGGWTPKRTMVPESGFSTDDRLYTGSGGQLHIHDDQVNRNSFYGIVYPTELEFTVTSQGVKNYLSVEVHADDIIPTGELGVETQLGQVSEINLPEDYTYRGEGVYTSNFLRDVNSPGGIVGGDRLKGRYIKIKLVKPVDPNNPMGELNLLKYVVKSNRSDVNIT